MASKHGETIDILRVPKAAAPEYNIFDPQRHFGLLALFKLNSTLEFVNLIIWLFTNQLA
jgi:hypothetical protein